MPQSRAPRFLWHSALTEACSLPSPPAAGTSILTGAAGVHPSDSNRPADPGARQAPGQPLHVPLAPHRRDVPSRLSGEPPQEDLKGRWARAPQIPRSPSHLRYHGPAERCGCKNCILHVGPFRRWVHSAGLHPRHSPEAGRSCCRYGQLHGASSIKAEKNTPDRKPFFLSGALVSIVSVVSFPRVGHGVGQKFLANPQSNFLQQKIPKNRSFREFLRSHYNLNIFKFSASGQNCTHPAFWPAARVRRTSVFTAGENLGAGAALPTPSIEIPKGGDRLRRSEPKTKGHPFGCPFVLELLPRFELGTSSLPSDFLNFF